MLICQLVTFQNSGIIMQTSSLFKLMASLVIASLAMLTVTACSETTSTRNEPSHSDDPQRNADGIVHQIQGCITNESGEDFEYWFPRALQKDGDEIIERHGILERKATACAAPIDRDGMQGQRIIVKLHGQDVSMIFTSDTSYFLGWIDQATFKYGIQFELNKSQYFEGQGERFDAIFKSLIKVNDEWTHPVVLTVY